MPFIILFQDNPDADPTIRSRHMTRHLAFLAANPIRAAGPLANSDGTPAGGIWIVDTDTEAQARALIEQDPFWPTGLRQSHQILTWTQVYPT